MDQSLKKLTQGYQRFRAQYTQDQPSIMQQLAQQGQNPEVMIVACSDSRVDPALILQCNPGDLFITRNVANIIPPYEQDTLHHGTSAALEYGIQFLKVKNLIIMGHSQCGGIQGFINPDLITPNDFISNWLSLADIPQDSDGDTCAKQSLLHSYQNCLTFPWIKQRRDQGILNIHLWFFDIEMGQLSQYSHIKKSFISLEND
jgi:carbonic anhydrase